MTMTVAPRNRNYWPNCFLKVKMLGLKSSNGATNDSRSCEGLRYHKEKEDTSPYVKISFKKRRFENDDEIND